MRLERARKSVTDAWEGFIGAGKAGRNTRGSITRSTRLVSSSARFNFVASQASILARFSNEPARVSS